MTPERPNIYADEAAMRAAVDGGSHRDIIGGLWDEVGALQFDWLVSRGLKPHHKLLDIGCGSGRLAIKAVPYLEPGNYYGQDISPALLDAARKELNAIGCGDRIGPDTFLASEMFEAPGEALFDYAIAQSVFTHLPIDLWGRCLDAIPKRLAPGAKLYATFFVAPYNTPALQHDPGGVITYKDKDPFHFHPEQITEQAIYRRWKAAHIGDWRHPRDQQMFEFQPPAELPVKFGSG
ncbi:MAG: SAM-dependent methyltransferase [Caulobacteraceae bacterium]